MKNNQHGKKLTPDQEKEFLSKLEMPYSRSKSDVWESLEAITGAKETPPKKQPAKVISIGWKTLSIAASFFIVLGLGLVARFYTTTIHLGPGEFTSHTLPDGSVVHLNAESTISYVPYWWSAARNVDLEGEAFFEVAKGKVFSVYSSLGATQVLGTSFNIYSRDRDYQVYCVTGKVEVRNDQASVVLLGPGEFAKVDTSGLIKPVPVVSGESILSWRLNKFIYNTTPLAKVFADVERHYNTRINLDIENIGEYHYTGLFSREVDVEQALEIICYSFDLTFDNESDDGYVVKGN